MATEILGADGFLTTEQREQKSKYHLLMSVQMTAQWLLDDTIDVNADLDARVAAQIIHFYLAVLEGDIDLTTQKISLRAACRKSGICENFVEALFLLAQWQRQLALAVNISLAPQSLYSQLNRELLMSSIQTHDVFDSWSQYTRYRSVNSGLTLEILCGAYWFCHLWNIDRDVLEQQAGKTRALIHRFSILGGVSNDLFGYDKDLTEGVVTSVEVVKRNLATMPFPREDTTKRAFAQIIVWHNQRLEELNAQLGRCEDPAERTLLFAALTTTWSIRLLHHEFMAIYRPTSLQNALGAAPTTGNALAYNL